MALQFDGQRYPAIGSAWHPALTVPTAQFDFFVEGCMGGETGGWGRLDEAGERGGRVERAVKGEYIDGG